MLAFMGFFGVSIHKHLILLGSLVTCRLFGRLALFLDIVFFLLWFLRSFSVLHLFYSVYFFYSNYFHEQLTDTSSVSDIIGLIIRIKIGNQSPNSERDSIMPCAVKSSFKTGLQISLSLWRLIIKTPISLMTKLVFTFQIGDHFFLNLNSVTLLCSWVVSVCFLGEGLSCWNVSVCLVLRGFTVQLQS